MEEREREGGREGEERSTSIRPLANRSTLSASNIRRTMLQGRRDERRGRGGEEEVVAG